MAEAGRRVGRPGAAGHTGLAGGTIRPAGTRHTRLPQRGMIVEFC